ncbi:DNA adenine methylase [Butyricicoccus sp.]|uniref:DNA adenine methylase n=1 Tax=Butyricicoccus sp. TaxID=2049021 RepID=UPI003F16C5E3
MIPALLKWIGNKQRFAELIVSYMPTEFNNYYEPFLGSGAVMAELLYSDENKMYPHFSHAYGSDVLPFLIGIFDIVKNEPAVLIDYYKSEIEQYMQDRNAKYFEIRDRFNENHNALDFCLLSRTCYSGIIRFRKSDGYMSTPIGPHKPISPDTFMKRVNLWHQLLEKASFATMDFEKAMSQATAGDVIYCDPPYTHSQRIIYGAQNFKIEQLWDTIRDCKQRGVKIMLSLNGTRESRKKNISVEIPDDLFKRKIIIDCGTSMIDRLQNTGKIMTNENVDDLLMLTW